MLTKIEEHQEFKKAKRYLDNLQKILEIKETEYQKQVEISLELDNTLGIFKEGDKPDFEAVKNAKNLMLEKKRLVNIANSKLNEAEEKLKETILEIKNLRKIEIKKEGLKLNKTILKIFDTIDQIREKYRILKTEIKKDFEALEIEGGYSAVIGADPTYVDFSNRLSYPSEAFLKDSKKYQAKEKDEIKDIK